MTDKSLTHFEQLRQPFPKGVVGKLPKGGTTLDYVGHAAVTDRLLTVDPEWTWEPMALDAQGLPALDQAGNLWIRLTVAGVTRIGVGDGKSMKERIGDAIRNAAMRFGVALDLWTKDELESGHAEEKPSLKLPPQVDPRRPQHDPNTPPAKTPEKRNRDHMFALLGDVGLGKDRDGALAFMSRVVARPISSSTELSDDEVQLMIQTLRDWKQTGIDPTTGEIS